MRLSLAVVVFLCSMSARAQVSVLESSTRAELVNGHTTIALAVKNAAKVPVDVRVVLTWLRPDGKPDGNAEREASLPPGESAVSIPNPLNEKSNPLVERLVYSVIPASRNYTAFTPVSGRLSLANIADYAFSLGVLTAGFPRPGQPFEMRVLAAHPITGRPVHGVTIQAEKATAVTGEDGVAVLRVPRDEDDDEGPIAVTARKGDFTNEGESTPLRNKQDDIRAYTDKPIYQPGQTMHVRVLAFDGSGKASNGRELSVRIENESGDLLHRAELKTSRFGVASTDWEIPPNAEAGKYTVYLKTDESDHYFLRSVSIRSYELPSFRVTAKPDRPFYLTGQKAQVEIRGEYLFGKPVTAGKVRIADADDEQSSLAEGALDSEGRFRASLDLGDGPDEHRNFEDHHLVAFLTDSSTNRTEQRKFDMRLSREPVHIYTARMETTAAGRRLYVTTYSPDGAPLRSDVEVATEAAVLGRGKTNRFGVARIDLPASDDELVIRAITADGLRAHVTETFNKQEAGLWLRTERSLYRVGEAIKVTVESARPDQPVLLVAMDENDRVLFTKNVRLQGGKTEVEIPYEKRFGRALGLGVASVGARDTAYRRVYFPGPADLVVKAIPGRATYRPGETATVQFEASAEAALGIAVVDQSVLERTATDSAFGRRGWFEDREDRFGPSLGGITESDLLNLEPAKIDDELQLVAEVLSPEFGALFNQAEDPMEEIREAFQETARKELAPVELELDRHYLSAFEYPSDDAAFQRMAGWRLAQVQDPWLQPYSTRFSLEGAYSVLSFVSSGPDKKPGTADDFTALQVQRKWFGPQESLMRRALLGIGDYPATPDEFVSLLEKVGLRFDALRDPWGGPLRVRVVYARRLRKIQILSAGPDHDFDTDDDVTVTELTGSYFAATEAAIDRALNAAQEFPSSPEEFRAMLMKSGVDLDGLRDPWGHGYYLAFRDDERFADQVRLYTYAEYNGVSEQRKEITPVKQTTWTVEIRSAGEDGVKSTYDDFAVATFLRVLKSPQVALRATVEGGSTPAVLAGKGTIAGVVKDQQGAVVSDAVVTLDDTYTTRTDAVGKFAFRALPAGKYRLSCNARGFQSSLMGGVPVADGHVTEVEMVLRVGTMTETVEVQAEAQLMSTMSAQTSSGMAGVIPGQAMPTLSTPRVREYFPETLYWQPELVTDSAGRASVRMKLADSVTTWHVAVIGSTVDGRIAEGSTDIRAFQPFLVDLDVPQVLTASDEIALPVPVRNYLKTGQKVAVTAKVAPELKLLEAVRQPGLVAPSSFADAGLTMRAESAAKSAKVRVTAVGGSASDAIEKPVGIHPDGERKVLAVSSVVKTGDLVPLTVGDAIAGSIQGEVKIYPSLLARILEAIEGMLQVPHGCAEQTISTAYPDLMLLKTLQETSITEEPLRQRATKYLLAGYRKLLGYQAAGGGFTYWGRGEADVALTAYALTFLADAAPFIAVDDDRVAQARQWLALQKGGEAAANSLRLRALAHTRASGPGDLDRELGEMARKAAEFGDPYPMAAYALAAMEAGKPELAGSVVEQLARMAHDERGSAYWVLRANTPFYGWGRWGQVESTGMVVSALARWRKAGHEDAALNTLIDRGALFLLRNTDEYGGWMTSQATVRALMALVDSSRHEDESQAAEVEVRVNGTSAGKVMLPAGRTVQAPLIVDTSRLLRAGDNQISLTGFGGHAEQIQLTARWYEAWGPKRPAKDLDMQVRYGALSAAINESVSCDVSISRKSFRGFGMMIAEVGLPPGAEVDRGVLEDIIGDWKHGVDSYEVAPDHVTFYVWPRAADVKFRFVFRPRYAMKAKGAQSVLYDFYNPDERVILAPERFVVR